MRKTMTLLMIMVITSVTVNTKAQKVKKTETITIQTSSECGMCKAAIEKAMAYEKGVISSELTVETGKISVKYKIAKTTPEKIRKAISDIGYDADDIKANKRAYNNLPNCCQKGGMDH